MLSGSNIWKLQSSNGKPIVVKIWLETKHNSLNESNASDVNNIQQCDKKPVHKICWKKTYKKEKVTLNKEDIDFNDETQPGLSINLGRLNMKLSKPKTVYLSSIIDIKIGQNTETFHKSQFEFSEDERKLSFSLITEKRSIDFVAKNSKQFESWVQCLQRLMVSLSDESGSKSNSLDFELFPENDPNKNDFDQIPNAQSTNNSSSTITPALNELTVNNDIVTEEENKINVVPEMSETPNAEDHGNDDSFVYNLIPSKTTSSTATMIMEDSVSLNQTDETLETVETFHLDISNEINLNTSVTEETEKELLKEHDDKENDSKNNQEINVNPPQLYHVIL